MSCIEHLIFSVSMFYFLLEAKRKTKNGEEANHVCIFIIRMLANCCSRPFQLLETRRFQDPSSSRLASSDLYSCSKLPDFRIRPVRGQQVRTFTAARNSPISGSVQFAVSKFATVPGIRDQKKPNAKNTDAELVRHGLPRRHARARGRLPSDLRGWLS